MRIDRDLAYLHLQVFSIRRAVDKLKYLAGSESGMGAFVTDILPEDIAHRLREVGYEVVGHRRCRLHRLDRRGLSP